MHHESKRRAIVGGTLLPFAAPLVDGSGRLRLDKGALDDAQIAAMDWFVQGVTGGVAGTSAASR